MRRHLRRMHSDFESWWLQTMPIVVVEHPFELLISLLCVLAGVPYIIGAVSSVGVEHLLPEILVRLWGIELTVGGVLTSIGLMARNSRIERAGLVPLAVSAFIYSWAVLFFVGLLGIVASFVTMAFGCACVSRAILLRAAEKIIRKAMRGAWEELDDRQ